jgi:hypothetical protein
MDRVLRILQMVSSFAQAVQNPCRTSRRCVSLSPQRVDAAYVQLERLPLRDGAELPLWGLKAVAQALSDSLRADRAW